MIALPKWSALRLPERIGWRDHLIGGALGLAYVIWLLSTAHAIGFPRDEGVYFRAGAEYAGWWRSILERGRDALTQSAIDGAWFDNHEHPALMKTLFGLSGWLFHVKWHVFDDASTAFRLPAMCTAGAALWTTYLFGARVYGRQAGLVAAVLLGLMPRVFFHAHLACFDVPIMAMWTIVLYVYWRAQQTRALTWIIAVGIAYGLMLETKHNAWFFPAVVVPHALFVQRREILRQLKAGRVSIPGSLVSMAILGPIVLVALWPYLWNDTLPRVQGWLEFHLNHEYYNIEYLGRNYFGPPSPKSYVPVMVFATVPTVTLVLFGVGAVERASLGLRRLVAWGKARFGEGERELAGGDVERERANEETDLLLFLSFAVAVGPFFLPKTPIFGGTKHWLPAYPALAIFAGCGFERVSRAMRGVLPRLSTARLNAAQGALFASVVAAPLAVTIHSHPFGLSSYVPFVGGTAGGASLGLNRQFWGYTSQNAAEEYLNSQAPRGASVFIHDTTWDAWSHMQEEGRVRRDLRGSGSPHDAQFSLVEHELHMSEVDYSVWASYRTDAPVYVVTHDGVPIVSIYRKP